MKSLWLLSMTISFALFMSDVTVSSSIQHLQRHKKHEHRNGTQPNVFQCISCKTGTQQVLNIILSSNTWYTVNVKIRMLCFKTGPFYNSCVEFSTQLAGKIFQLLGQLEPAKWCAFLGFCYYPPHVPVCKYCYETGLTIKSMLLSKHFLSELYNNTLAMCNEVPTYSFVCGPVIHDVFMAITLSFNKQFLVQRFCQNAGFC
ncbi:unnamed protein product [Trichobilharzia szidati]|nr:unnamed protein product [Trichobilharzia szidati]